jgi:ferrous iron transport protein B
MVVALTMADRLEGAGSSLDLLKISNLLGVEVVRLVGHREQGIKDLKDAIERGLTTPRTPNIELGLPNNLEFRVAALRERMARFGADCTAREIRQGLLTPSVQFTEFLAEHPEIREAFDSARASLEAEGVFPAQLDVDTRYRWAQMIRRAVVTEAPVTEVKKRSVTDRIDAVLTHRVFGLTIFVGVMYIVFQSIYTFAQPFMDLIDGLFKSVQGFVSPHLDGVPILQSLVVDGLIKGTGAMLVFLPQILILFFFIALLEGTGYLARAAFLMDRLLGWCGLNGRAFIPLLSSFACAIPGIMAARVMPDPKSRLATILVAPLMSCSARLPVYLLLISAFIQPRYGAFWAGFTLFAMHLLGLFVAIPIVFVFNRKMIRGKRLPFLLELPPYQWPKWRDVLLAMYFRGRVFVKTAGTIIVFMSVLIWAAAYFPHMGLQETSARRSAYVLSHPGASQDVVDRQVQEEQLANSVLGRFGRSIEPAFRPAGFDWRITTSILCAFPARETVVPSLGIIFSLGDDVEAKDANLQKAVKDATWPDGRPLFTVWTAAGMMIFFALCAQCMATLATVKRETNSWKWPAFMFVYMTVLAYIAAVLVHLLGVAFGSA